MMTTSNMIILILIEFLAILTCTLTDASLFINIAGYLFIVIQIILAILLHYLEKGQAE